MRVLVVEDERKLAQVLESALRAEHYDVVVATTGEEGFFRANAETFDLVLLDPMLPGPQRPRNPSGVTDEGPGIAPEHRGRV